MIKYTYAFSHIIFNQKLPSIYSDFNPTTLEHVFPKSYIVDNKNKGDMHNLFKCNKYINNMRSNYKFVDENDYNLLNEKWIKLDNNNYVNTKNKLFIPNSNYKGLISRAIMYMSYSYNLDYNNIIDYDNLILWCSKNPPCKKEEYHNYVVSLSQKKKNLFISSFNDTKYLQFIKYAFK